MYGFWALLIVILSYTVANSKDFFLKYIIRETPTPTATLTPSSLPSEISTPSPSPVPKSKTNAQTTRAPSQKDLEVVSYFYINSNDETRNKMLDQFGGPNRIPTEAIRNFTIYLESDPTKMALLTSIINQAINQQTKIVVPTNTFPTHCTSNSVGDYTYTNCY